MYCQVQGSSGERPGSGTQPGGSLPRFLGLGNENFAYINVKLESHDVWLSTTDPLLCSKGSGSPAYKEWLHGLSACIDFGNWGQIV
jgi:hypothetical protein